jgi:hypothetical protein
VVYQPAQSLPEVPDLGVRIAHAAGMVSAQLDCNLDTAMVLLRKRAELIGRDLEVIAAAVIDRRLSFSPRG